MAIFDENVVIPRFPEKTFEELCPHSHNLEELMNDLEKVISEAVDKSPISDLHKVSCLRMVEVKYLERHRAEARKRFVDNVVSE